MAAPTCCIAALTFDYPQTVRRLGRDRSLVDKTSHGRTGGLGHRRRVTSRASGATPCPTAI